MLLIYIIAGILLLLLIVYIYSYFAFSYPLRKKESGFKYVFIEEDGTVRELSKEEEKYLSQKFLPGDSGRPFIKFQYAAKTPTGKISGYIPRRRVPQNIPIRKADLE